MDYTGSESGIMWIKVESIRTDGRIITKCRKEIGCGHELDGPASRLGKLAGSCEKFNKHLSP